MNPSEILDNEISDCENWSVDEGTIMSAPGYVSWDISLQDGPFWGIYQFKKSDGTQKLIRQRQGTLEYDSDDSGTWVECTLPTTGSPAATIELTEKLATFATLNDTVVFANGQIVMYSTDGITWTNDTDLIYGGAVPDIVFNNGKNRLFYIIKDTSLIWWSDINSPQVVGTASWQAIDPNAGAPIVGMGLSPDGAVLCFKENALYSLDDITLGMIGVNFLGKTTISSHHSIATTENSVIWAGKAGEITEFIGGTIRIINGRIDPTGRNWIGRMDLVCATFYNGRYLISMPDNDVDQDYNAQEYVVHKNLTRNDPVQPYVITRNSRNFGCYGQEFYDSGNGEEWNLYMGSSVSTTAGSPATTSAGFWYSNDYRDPTAPQGLNGETQTGYFTTKFYTDDIPYYVKKYKKLFMEINISNDTTISLYYRFSPYGAWTEVSIPLETGEILWLLEDDTEGQFDEGYGFQSSEISREYIDIENEEKPRGVQFKIEYTSVTDITLLSIAYTFKAKSKFK